MLSSWKALQIIYFSIFVFLSIIYTVYLILSCCFQRSRYHILFQIISLCCALFHSLLYFIITFITIKKCVIIFNIGTCLFGNIISIFFFFLVHEWESLCRQQAFNFSSKLVIFIIVFFVFSATATSEVCSLLIQNPSVPYLDFFIMSIALIIKLCFILGYGSIHIRSIVLSLQEQQENGSYSFKTQLQIATVFEFITIILGIGFFGVFISSFYKNLDKSYIYQTYILINIRLPFLVIIISSFLLQELMENIYKHVVLNFNSSITDVNLV